VLKELGAQRLLALFLGAWLPLNFPLLSLWDVDVFVLGLPLLPVALLSSWAMLIALLAWLMEHEGAPEEDC